MKERIEGFTQQLAEALRIGQAADLARQGSDIRNVLVTGVGSSGISANLVESLTFGRIPIPVTVCRGYNIPQFVSPHTLFIACSYTGNTEETLSAVQKAVLKRANIICITSGGKLLELAKEYNFLHIRIPDGSNSPRFMLGYQVVSLLSALYHTNLIGAAFIRETENAIDYLDHYETAIRADAQSIARKLKSKLPFIYCDGRLQAMALRFQQQLNENAHQLAHVNTFPELNHNEIMGWQFPAGVLNQAQVLYLYSDHDHERVDKRMELCRSIFEKRSNPVIEIRAQGASLLEQYYYLIHLTDWISYFLAIENQVDPDATETVLLLKEELTKIK
ncbi:MAG TPA: bifunctional phosphoglucose/phosphomannose isomerase [Cyclobacteriaceae bacterium]|nr:bifunctional phosphoglucose/phosphomannose isomerase [Cyclobacteriaceae bacterium]